MRVTEKLGGIQSGIYEERKGREESYDQLIKNLGSEIMRVNRLVHAEKKSREENQDEILALVNALYEKFTREIEVSLSEWERGSQEKPGTAAEAAWADMPEDREEYIKLNWYKNANSGGRTHDLKIMRLAL